MSFIASLFGIHGGSGFGDDDHFIHRLVAPRTAAGTRVDEIRSLAIPAVYRAVVVIADAVALLPIGVFQKTDKGREPRPDHPVQKLLQKPNPLMSRFSLRNASQSHALLWGNAFLEIQRTQGGRPERLWPLLPDRTHAKARKFGRGDRMIVYRTIVDAKPFDIEPANILHVPAMSFDGLRGHSPIWLARNAMGLALALEEFGSKFFSNDAKSGGFLSHPGKLSEEAQKNIRESMERQAGLDNAHRIKILEEGMTFQVTTIPPEDAQFLLSRQFQIEEIGRLFGVPLHMLQSQAKSTSWGTGIAQMSLGFLIYTVAPWLLRWEQEYDRKLFTEQEQEDGFFTKHNTTALLRTDPKQRGEFYTKALNTQTGWMTREEVRALEDLNPDELDDEDEPDAIAPPPAAPSPPAPVEPAR